MTNMTQLLIANLHVNKNIADKLDIEKVIKSFVDGSETTRRAQ